MKSFSDFSYKFSILQKVQRASSKGPKSCMRLASRRLAIPGIYRVFPKIRPRVNFHDNFNIKPTLKISPISVFFKLFSSRPILHRKIFSRPLKKDLHLESISDSAIFPQKSRCSLKKKKGLHFDFISDFPIFLPKSRCSLKKKKVFTSISSLISLFFSQTHGDLQKLKSKIPRPPV